MKKTIVWLMKLFGAGLLSMAILSAFVLVYDFSGTHIENKAGATDYKWKSGQLKSNMQEGFSWSVADKNGFNNSYEKPAGEDIDILLMGSSHMEAFTVNPDKTTAYRLNSLLKDRKMYCYNIGVSGHTLTRCVSNIASAVKQYNPSGYVIIETSSVDLKIEEMNEVINGSFPKLKSYDSGFVYYMQKIPCLKVLYKQFEDIVVSNNTNEKKDKASSADQAKSAAKSADKSTEYEKVLNEFLSKAENDVNDKKLIVFYHPTLEINYDGTVTPLTNEEKLSAFSKACEKSGIIFVDMTEDFLNEYNNENILPHGFFNTSVGKGHLNNNGHRLIAEKLYETITDNSKVAVSGGEK